MRPERRIRNRLWLAACIIGVVGPLLLLSDKAPKTIVAVAVLATMVAVYWLLVFAAKAVGGHTRDA